MRGLERFREPWTIEAQKQRYIVRDAGGQLMLTIYHRQDLYEQNYTIADNYLSVDEALHLARYVSRLPILNVRPQY